MGEISSSTSRDRFHAKSTAVAVSGEAIPQRTVGNPTASRYTPFDARVVYSAIHDNKTVRVAARTLPGRATPARHSAAGRTIHKVPLTKTIIAAICQERPVSIGSTADYTVCQGDILFERATRTPSVRKGFARSWPCRLSAILAGARS